MEYQIESIENVTVIKLKGSFDRSSRGSMEMELLSLLRYRIQLIFDLSEVNFISSAGLHLLLDMYRRCDQQNGRMALAGLPDPVRNIFAMTGFESSGIPIFDTLEEALAAFQKKRSSGNYRGDFSYEDSAESIDASPDESGNGGGKGEEVHFSAFYPKEVAVKKWYTLLVYTYIPSALESVRADARRFEDEIGDMSETKPATNARLARGTQITIVPSGEGVTFNPEQITFKWLEDRHRAQFRFQADASLAGTGGNVLVTVYVGPLIVATLKMGMLFNETESNSGPARSEEATARMYNRDEIFISYSHKDTDLIRSFKVVHEATGHNVLIDTETLRSGQTWNEELMRMIKRANVFQLFWSENSSKSEYCRQEWQYALGLNREEFIRPVYWKKPLPAPPAELSALHFAFAEFTGQD